MRMRPRNDGTGIALTLAGALLLSVLGACGLVKIEHPGGSSSSASAEDDLAAARKAEKDGPCGGPATSPKRAYLKSEGRAVTHDGSRRAVDEEDLKPIPTVAGLRDRTTWLPPNTSVDVIRRLEFFGGGPGGRGGIAVSSSG